MNYTEEMNRALLILARVDNNTYRYWWSIYDENGDELGGDLYRCCICNSLIEHSSNVWPHGVEHLKKKGLLVFL